LQVYEAVKDKKISDVAMTAEWEMALQKIENNSIADIDSLVSKGKTNLIKGGKSNSGNKFNFRIVMNDKAKTSFEFDNRQPKRK